MTLCHAEGRFIGLPPPIYGGKKQGKLNLYEDECLYNACIVPVHWLYTAYIVAKYPQIWKWVFFILCTGVLDSMPELRPDRSRKVNFEGLSGHEYILEAFQKFLPINCYKPRIKEAFMGSC